MKSTRKEKTRPTMEVEDASTPGVIGEGQAAANKFPSGLRVLLVEDDPASLLILRRKLEVECNYEVTWCTGAKEALSLLSEKNGEFDIVLTELQMPDMDGLQFLDSIRSSSAPTHQMPVILLSGEYNLEAAARAIEKGACDFLLKPIPDDILKMIWQHALRLKLRKEGAAGSFNNGAATSSEINQHVSESDRLEHSSSENITTTLQGGGSLVPAKPPRIRWTADLHQKFRVALTRVNLKKYPKNSSHPSTVNASPKEILEELKKMGETCFSRQHISSYLQKYRASLKEKEVSVVAIQSMKSNLSGASANYPIHHQPFHMPDVTCNPSIQLPNYSEHPPIMPDQASKFIEGSSSIYQQTSMPFTAGLPQFFRVMGELDIECLDTLWLKDLEKMDPCVGNSASSY
ncbi:hypothetical protein SAY87_014505 [Trapa incisa]|uniref:Response regulatory domain-containing protein n=1 Tax=Trapa incisa TaxID=236973 RepID=A0AAN7GSQ7_9MYRT|nr:hypothetical protein SAY87_014505 [Trapa incisa]